MQNYINQNDTAYDSAPPLPEVRQAFFYNSIDIGSFPTNRAANNF